MARLSLYLLGPPRIECDGVPLKVDTRKAIALLAYLAVTGESYRRDSLGNLLWPEYDQSHGRAALRRTLSALKKALAGDWLDVDRENVSLKLGADIWLDVDQFHSHLTQCLTHDHASTQVCPACLSPLTEAVALYRDDFLCGFSLKDSFNFDDWQFFQAEALRRDLTGALKRIAHYYGTQQNYELAIDYVRQWLERDHLSESAHYQMMQLYAWSGQRSAALRQYEECTRMLKSQLGVVPQESTQELYQAIKEGRAPPPDSSPVQKIGKKDETNAGFETQVIFPRDITPSPTSTSNFPQEEKRIVTVLFADSSASFEGQGAVSPEDEVLLANSLLEMLQNVLVKYGGMLEHCLGGSALAVFGKTRTRENDSELAIRAALEICAEAETAGLRVSIGINTGEIFLRRSSSDKQSTITLVGTVVNQAVGLAGKTPDGKILVGKTTHQLTHRAFEFTSHSLNVKGIDKPVTAYQVERLLPQAAQARGIEGLKSELVGRDKELAKLKQNLANVLQGQGQMVSLIGEAGVGKSRLVAELKAGALIVDDDKTVPLWLEGRCLELGTVASYWPFIDILREYFAWEAKDDNRQRLARIVASLQEMVKQRGLIKERVEQMWPYLGLLLSVRLDGEEEDKLKRESPEQIRQQTFLAISDFFLALAQQQPVVLVFEDLHWADDLSLDLISLLMERLRSTPLLLLCVYRPEQEHRCCHLGTIAAQKCRSCYTELYLRELTRQQSQRLVESLLAIENLPAQAKDLILSKSQGNPFFIEEIVHSLIEADLIYQKGDVWHAHPALDATVVPHSIQSTILSRVDHLAAEWRHVLQIASVIGRVFQQSVLDYAVQQVDLANVLWELEERALIYQERTIPELEHSFKHVLMQEAVYQNIPRRRREVIHRQVAEAIEALYPDSLDEHYEKLAYHYDRSACLEQAVTFLLKAGEKAKRSHANEIAITHLKRGLELLETAPETSERIHQELALLVALGVPLVHTLGHAAPEVEITYNRARDLCEQIGDGTGSVEWDRFI